MFDIKSIKIDLNGDLQKKVLEFLKETWIGIPKALRNVLIITIIAGGGYFLYNRITLSYEIESLQHEVEFLNNLYEKIVLNDRYFYDIQNVIVTVTTIQRQIDVQHDTRIALLESLKRYFLKNHPEDSRIIKEIDAIMETAVFEKEQYDKIIQHQVDMYKGTDLSDELRKDILQTGGIRYPDAPPRKEDKDDEK